MRKTITYILLLICILSATNTSIAFTEKDEELGELQKKISRQQKELAEGKKLESSLNREILNLEREADSTQSEMLVIQENIEGYQQNIDKTINDLKIQEMELEKQSDNMAIHFRAMYKRGNLSTINVLLNYSNIDNVMKNAERIHMIYESDKNALLKMKSKKEIIVRQRENLLKLQMTLE